MSKRDVQATLDLAVQTVIKALKDNGLPESWWEGRNAELRIHMIVAAAAPVIEEACIDWMQREVLPLIADDTLWAKRGGDNPSPSTS
jgi:hypothetical protein